MKRVQRTEIRKPAESIVQPAAASAAVKPPKFRLGNNGTWQKELPKAAKGWKKPVKAGNTATGDPKKLTDGISGNDPALAVQLQKRKGRGKYAAYSDAVPDMETVYSSNVRSIGYNEKQKELFVSFKDGSVYKYFQVPKSIYNDLMYAAAELGSVGGRFWDLIRERGSAAGTQYTYLKIKGKKEKVK